MAEPKVSAALQRATEAHAKVNAFEFPAHSDREGDVIAEAREALAEIQRLLRPAPRGVKTKSIRDIAFKPPSGKRVSIAKMRR